MNTYIKYITSGAVSIAILASALPTFADNGQNNHTNGLITALSQKFNLNYNDVLKVFTDFRVGMKTTMDQKFEAKLDKAVANGKITATQKAQILAKRAELITFRASLEGKSKEEIKTAVKAKMVELKQWIKDNNIPVNYLNMRGGLKWHMGGFGHM